MRLTGYSAGEVLGRNCRFLQGPDRPCDELAGDALNVLRLDDDRVGLYVLDVSGHGVPAALMPVTLTRFLSPSFDRSFLLSPAPRHPSGRSITAPARVAELLNQQFPMDPETSQYFTMLCGVLERAGAAAPLEG